MQAEMMWRLCTHSQPHPGASGCTSCWPPPVPSCFPEIIFTRAFAAVATVATADVLLGDPAAPAAALPGVGERCCPARCAGPPWLLPLRCGGSSHRRTSSCAQAANEQLNQILRLSAARQTGTAGVVLLDKAGQG